MAKTASDDLYETDFYEWTKTQADALRLLARERSNVPLDLPNLIEEIQDLGNSLKSSIESQLARVIEHCLKLEHSLAWEPRRIWRLSIVEARQVIERKMTPTLRRAVSRDLQKTYAGGRKLAVVGLEGHGEDDTAEALPQRCPYTLDQLCDPDWFPENRRGIVERAGAKK
jgi:hypothetical protein